jgi:uncharacterized protein YhaN
MKLMALVVVLGLTLAGCGESDEDKAKSDVCDARADIQTNVKELQGLTIGTATADKVKSNLDGIRDGLAKIGDARANLDGARKRQVEKANETFKSEVQALVDDLGKSTSLQDAAQQLKTDIAGLASAYQESLGPIDCS